LRSPARGSIGVYSEIGKGTAFKVYFPRVDATEMVVDVPAPLARPHAGTHTVLVVEDEEGLRDVLLTDVVMPGASGPELTRQLVEQRPALRVIYMSGYNSAQDDPSIPSRRAAGRP